MVDYKDEQFTKITDINTHYQSKNGIKDNKFKYGNNNNNVHKNNDNLKLEKLSKEVKDKNMEIMNLKNEIYTIKQSHIKSNSILKKKNDSEINSVDKNKKTLNMIKRDKLKHVSLNDTDEIN